MNKSSILTVGVIASAWLLAANGPQAPLAAPAQEKAGVTKFEYKIVYLGIARHDGTTDEKVLNELGADGWDAGPILANTGTSPIKLILKRPKR